MIGVLEKSELQQASMEVNLCPRSYIYMLDRPKSTTPMCRQCCFFLDAHPKSNVGHGQPFWLSTVPVFPLVPTLVLTSCLTWTSRYDWRIVWAIYNGGAAQCWTKQWHARSWPVWLLRSPQSTNKGSRYTTCISNSKCKMKSRVSMTTLWVLPIQKIYSFESPTNGPRLSSTRLGPVRITYGLWNP